MYYVYMLRCVDGTLYVGIARELAIRMQRHNCGKGAKYTRSRLPVSLVYTETAVDRSAAQSREYELKHYAKPHKEALVQQYLQEHG